MKAPAHLLVAAGIALLGVPSARAGGASFSLTPLPHGPAMPRSTSYFVVDSRPGKRIVQQALLTNTGSATGTATIYAVDALTGRTSGAVYRARRFARRDVGAWISLRRRSITLGPGKSTVIRFVVRVPARVRPGDHLGGIVAESRRVTASRSQKVGRVRLRVRVRLLSIAAVLVRLPGGACRMSIGGVRPRGRNGVQYLNVGLRNPGDRLTKASGVLTLRTTSGRRVARRRFKLDTIVPRTAIAYPVRLGSALPTGRYRATVSLAGCSTARRLTGLRPWVLGSSPGGRTRVTKTVRFSVSRAQRAQVLAGRRAPQPAGGGAPTTPGGGGGSRGGIGSAVSHVIGPAVAGLGAAALLAALVGFPAVLSVGRRRRPPSTGGRDDGLE